MSLIHPVHDNAFTIMSDILSIEHTCVKYCSVHDNASTILLDILSIEHTCVKYCSYYLKMCLVGSI